MSHRLRIPVVALLPLAAAGCSDDPLGHFADVFDLDTQVGDTDAGEDGGRDGGEPDTGATDTGATDTGRDVTEPDASLTDAGEDPDPGDAEPTDTRGDAHDDAGTDDATPDAEPADAGDASTPDAGDAGPADADPTDAGPSDTGSDTDPTDTGFDTGFDIGLDGGTSDAGGDTGDVVLPPDIEALLRSFCELSLSCTELPFYETIEDCVDFRAIFFADLAEYYGDDCTAAYADYMACVSELECDDYYYAYTACETTYDAFVSACFGET